jgi:hypothetical protein
MWDLLSFLLLFFLWFVLSETFLGPVNLARPGRKFFQENSDEQEMIQDINSPEITMGD